VNMSQLEGLRVALPEAAKDIKLNIQAALSSESLNAAQRWGSDCQI